jgi:hypothetical protein
MANRVSLAANDKVRSRRLDYCSARSSDSAASLLGPALGPAYDLVPLNSRDYPVGYESLHVASHGGFDEPDISVLPMGSGPPVMHAPSRKRAGAYYTPELVAASLAHWAVHADTDRMLDPACGDGRFISAHRNSVGIEQNPQAAATAMNAAWAAWFMRVTSSPGRPTARNDLTARPAILHSSLSNLQGRHP